MKRLFRLASNWLLPLTLLGAAPPVASAQTTTKTYTADNTNFANPERGFYDELGPVTEGTAPLTAAQIQGFRSRNITLFRHYYFLGNYKDKALSQGFLDRITDDLRVTRENGAKMLVYFIYSGYGATAPPTDAPLNIIKTHLDQIAPVLQANYDVIAYMEAGFVGIYGEWWNSSNGHLTSSATGDNANANSREILEKMLDVLPKDRMVALRYPRHKWQVFNNNNPLPVGEAYSKTNRARVGHANYAFRSNITDSGTYGQANDATSIENDKAWVSQDTKYILQGGEPAFASTPATLDDCPGSLTDFARMHYSAMTVNRNDAAALYQGWKDQGCYDEIARRLGYRYQLMEGSFPTQVAAGSSLQVSLKLRNEGWARLYNPRHVELVLRSGSTVRRLRYQPGQDERLWLPGPVAEDGAKTLALSVTVPSDLPVGSYELLLNLPDPLGSLNTRPEYSIRLANQNMWEASTGYNKLDHTLTVTSPTPSTGPVANGIYTLTARHSGKRLDVSGSSATDGARVQQYAPNPSDAQRWQLTAVGSDGYCTLTAQCSGKKLALDLNPQTNGGFADVTGNGVQVFQYGTNAADNRLWKVEATDGGYYKLTNKASGKCLDVYGGPSATNDGAVVKSWQYVGGTNQQWKLEASPGAAASRLAAVAQPALQVYPNPSSGGAATLVLTAAAAQMAAVQVRDMHGQVVRAFAVPVGEGQTEWRLPAALPRGTYFVHTRLDGQTQRFTLQVE